MTYIVGREERHPLCDPGFEFPLEGSGEIRSSDRPEIAGRGRRGTICLIAQSSVALETPVSDSE